MKKPKRKPKTRRAILLNEAKAAEIRATYHDYYGRKTPEYYAEMRLAGELRRMAAA
jgi:hypothetical protein